MTPFLLEHVHTIPGHYTQHIEDQASNLQIQNVESIIVYQTIPRFFKINLIIIARFRGYHIFGLKKYHSVLRILFAALTIGLMSRALARSLAALCYAIILSEFFAIASKLPQLAPQLLHHRPRIRRSSEDRRGLSFRRA